VNALTTEQRAIALFWADDPGQTATPPGHSVSILGQVLRAQERSLADAAVAYVRLGVAVCDAFIACWRVKYIHNLIRPISYIRSHIDPAWGDPLPVTTPPFPEYTSGHSVQSAAAAEVLAATFGEVTFTDHTHDGRGLAPRSFGSFAGFAQEAAISRLYGGIHYRSAIDRGLEQGRCIGAAVAALPLRR
jgi:membrane-associated phospholipid phosphatase